MNNLDQKNSNIATIGREHWDVPVRVELRAYLDFTRRMNIQLRRLMERWENKSRPASGRFHRTKPTPK